MTSTNSSAPSYETTHRSLPILPVRDTVLFPHAVLPLTVGREGSMRLINALGEDKTIVVVAQREARVDAPQPTDLYTVGTLGVVHKVVKQPNQSLFVFVEGLERVRLLEFLQLSPFMRAQVTTIPEAIPLKNSEVEALRRNVLTLFQQIVAGSPTLSDELSTVAMNIEEPGLLVDFIASSLPSLSTADKQDTLETTDVRMRLEQINECLTKELEVLQLLNKLQSRVQDRVQAIAVPSQPPSLPVDASALDMLAVASIMTAEQIADAGLRERVESARREMSEAIRVALDSLKEFNVTTSDLKQIIDRRVVEEAAELIRRDVKD